MIKQNKKVRIIKNFIMQHTITHFMPSAIKDKDIHAMFSGLFSVMQNYASNQAKREQEYNKMSYDYLMGLYLNAVKNMNKYKALYQKALNDKKVVDL